MHGKRFGAAAPILCLCLAISASNGYDVGDKWEYSLGKNGVNEWRGICKDGRAQSPIGIDSLTAVQDDNLEPMVFENYDRLGQSMQLFNNGRTVKFDIESAENPFKIRHGGLPGTQFQFIQGHFHWGTSSAVGSEHLLDKKQYPMELHLVHFNMDLGKDLIKAVQSRSYNALAVLGIMFELHPENNMEIQPFFDALSNVETEEDKTTLTKTDVIPLKSFLPRNTDMFYRYNGSLTTPGCAEIVVWTIFKQPVKISEKQLNAMRKLTSGGPPAVAKKLGDNFRPPKPTNNRTVLDVDTSRKLYTYVKEDAKEEGSGGSGGSVVRFTQSLQLMAVVSVGHFHVL